jgi:hypothetical protein
MNVAVSPTTVEAAATSVTNDEERFQQFFLNTLRSNDQKSASS